MKFKLGIFVILAGGMFFVFSPKPTCIEFYLDYGSLKNSVSKKCIDSKVNVNALEFLTRNLNLEIEGTAKYGNSIVCRINGYPDLQRESCASMPPENAFWAIILKKHSSIPFVRNDWGWAQEGIDKIDLAPGDSLGLIFKEGENLKWPK